MHSRAYNYKLTAFNRVYHQSDDVRDDVLQKSEALTGYEPRITCIILTHAQNDKHVNIGLLTLHIVHNVFIFWL